MSDSKQESNVSYTVVNRTVIDHDQDSDAALADRLEQLALSNPDILKELGSEWADFKQQQTEKNPSSKPPAKSEEKTQESFTIVDYNPQSHSIFTSNVSSADEKKNSNEVESETKTNIDLSQIEIIDQSDIAIKHKLIKINEFPNCTFGLQLIIYPKNQISIWIGIVNPLKKESKFNNNNNNNDNNDNINNDKTNGSKLNEQSKDNGGIDMIPNLNNLFLSLSHRKSMHNDVGKRNISTIALKFSQMLNGNENSQNRLGNGNTQSTGMDTNNDDFAKKLSLSLVQYGQRKFDKKLTIQASCDIPNQVLNAKILKKKNIAHNRNNDLDLEMMQRFSNIGFELEKAMIEILKQVLCKDESECKDADDMIIVD